MTERRQLGLFGPVSATSGVRWATSGHALESRFRCVGMVLPRDFHSASVSTLVIHHALCMPAAEARLSLCALQRHEDAPSAQACSGAVWLWAFQDPATAQAQPFPLCSAHEQQTCHCPTCQAPISPYAVRCVQCMARAHEESSGD
jgi:hypothetical protein